MGLMKPKTYRELNKALAQQALQEVRRTWAWKGIWLALGVAAAYRAAAEAWGRDVPLMAFAIVVLMLVLYVVWPGSLGYLLIREGSIAYVVARVWRKVWWGY